jgi:hypothetical protein
MESAAGQYRLFCLLTVALHQWHGGGYSAKSAEAAVLLGVPHMVAQGGSRPVDSVGYHLTS